ncbi:hypothetical protein [Thioalkalivibrio sp. HK1]|uniref:hypothetical protein n=1 Tax=Thioalkalivibrio sp. HK1 TaxID=1469245 RepID=UPI0004ADCC81|nr:hypothetical protein [Thioalkalivibrio sp. HK1]
MNIGQQRIDADAENAKGSENSKHIATLSLCALGEFPLKRVHFALPVSYETGF